MKELVEFNRYYKSCLKIELPAQERRPQLRVSGFPYCGLRDAYTRLENKSKNRTFGLDYYCSVGTSTHTAVQEFLGCGGRIYGAWKCPSCGATKEFSCNNICKNCKQLMNYEELTVNLFSNLSGHLDGVYLAKNGRFYVVDYKTTSIRVLNSDMLPFKKHVVQIKSYCALVECCFNIEISGWILHYVSRDNPEIHHRTVGDRISSKTKKMILKTLEGYDTQFTIVEKLKSFRDIERLIEMKPCKNPDIYYKHYHSFEGCPLGKSGVCFNKRKLTNLLSLTYDQALEKL